MTRIIYISFRVLGLCVAAFFLLSSAADIAGLVPYSMDPPPSLESRVFKSLPLLFFAILLVLPYGKLRRGWFQNGALGALALFTLIAAAVSLGGIYDGIRGTKDWRIIPAMGVFAAILIGNCSFVIWTLKKKPIQPPQTTTGSSAPSRV